MKLHANTILEHQEIQVKLLLYTQIKKGSCTTGIDHFLSGAEDFTPEFVACSFQLGREQGAEARCHHFTLHFTIG